MGRRPGELDLRVTSFQTTGGHLEQHQGQPRKHPLTNRNAGPEDLNFSCPTTSQHCCMQAKESGRFPKWHLQRGRTQVGNTNAGSPGTLFAVDRERQADLGPCERELLVDKAFCRGGSDVSDHASHQHMRWLNTKDTRQCTRQQAKRNYLTSGQQAQLNKNTRAANAPHCSD